MTPQPKYDYIFEYLDEHYEFQSPNNPLTRFYKKDIAENQYANLDGPISTDKVAFKSAEDAAEMVSEFAWAAGADLVGFTKVSPSFVFEGNDVPHKYAVSLVMEMDFDRIDTAPEPPSGTEVLRIYWRLGAVAVKVAEFIRSLGYPAVAHHPRGFVGRHPTILHTRAAIDAGLGEAGRHGLLITEEFGPRVRAATVTTDLELPQSKQKIFGVDEYCQTCHLCQQACEGDAIPSEKIEIRGELKYSIDPYKCLPYFAKYDGCNLCVSKCAFNKKPEELIKMINKIRKND
jgi:ferredoxin